MRILLVDDDRESVAFMETVLQACGHETIVAHDGQRALAAAESTHPDMLALELLLPVRSGFWVLEHLRQMNLPTVVTTTLQKRQHRDYARELGVHSYLTKPYSAQQLLACIAEIESRHMLPATA